MPVSKAEFDAGTAPNCRNKNCKSYGKPHPNCHCFEHYNGILIGHAPRYAKGGRVPEVSFCASGGDPMHKKDCPYYCEGGASYAKGGEVEKKKSSSWSQASPAKKALGVLGASHVITRAIGFAEGGEVDGKESSDNDMIMDQCAMECMHAIETKDKAAFLDAFHVLVADIMQKISGDMEMQEGEK